MDTPQATLLECYIGPPSEVRSKLTTVKIRHFQSPAFFDRGEDLSGRAYRLKEEGIFGFADNP